MTKFLLLERAFNHGYGRVRIQADVMNHRSRRAIEALGAQFEGVVRRDKQRADGSWRDTALYSILIDEWPAVAERLERRITDKAFAPSLGAASLSVG
jgi:RimJ/RimL family protein N-acetyltransferase